MTHGDLGNPGELGYRVLRKVLRLDAVHSAMKLFPQKWIYMVGKRSAQLSREYQRCFLKSNLVSRMNVVRDIYRATATGILEHGYDVVLMGHTHLPDDFPLILQGRSCRYINTGDWLQHFTYLEFDGMDFYTRTHPIINL